MANESARAVVFTSPGVVEIQPQSVEPGVGETIVSTKVCGISHGTEMLFFNGPFPSGHDLEALDSVAACDYPIKYGYMAVGVTSDARRVFAFYPHQSAFAAPVETLVELPDSLGDDDAIFLPSMETALQIVHDSAPRLGESIAVFGLGMIGTLVALLLGGMDLNVVVADPIAGRRSRLEGLGFRSVDPATPGASGELAELTRGGPDTAINTSGSGDALQMAIDILRREGTVVEASWYGGRRSELSLGAAFHRRRLTLRSSQVSNLNPAMTGRWDRERRTATVLRLLARLTPSRFISHRFALDDASSAYRTIRDNPGDLFQVVLDV